MAMLSDSLREFRMRVAADALPHDRTGLDLELRAYEMEARNMENRIEIATSRPHVPLDGALVSAPSIEIGGAR